MARTTKPKAAVELHHPTLSGVSETVAADAVDAWVEAGWRKGVSKVASENVAEEPIRDNAPPLLELDPAPEA